MEVEVIGMGVEEEGSSTPNGQFNERFWVTILLHRSWSIRSFNWKDTIFRLEFNHLGKYSQIWNLNYAKKTMKKTFGWSFSANGRSSRRSYVFSPDCILLKIPYLVYNINQIYDRRLYKFLYNLFVVNFIWLI